jgi:hypothetical protein
MTTVTNKQKAQSEAIALAVAQLRKINVNALLAYHAEHSEASGVQNGDARSFAALRMTENTILLRVFGQNLKITLPDFDITVEGSTEPVKPADQILVLHYLLCEVPAEPTGELISFRDLPGGQFYLEPYRARTTKPLVAHFQNDLDTLRTALNCFDWTQVDLGDLGACVQAVGNFHLTLVYHRGDEDFGPEAEILFDACIKRVFCTEDAAVLAARLCRGLIGKRCVSCSGCGVCNTRAYSNS